jgi:hypothetical protein
MGPVYGLPPMDYMRRSDFPRPSKGQKLAVGILLLVLIGLGVALAALGDGTFALVRGAIAIGTVVLLTVGLIFVIRHSRPARKRSGTDDPGRDSANGCH